MSRKMKDSGIEWIGDIPDNWNIGYIGQIYTERKQKVSDRDFEPLSVTMNGIVPQLSTAAKTDAHDDRKLVKKGDFAINSRSDRRGSCGIAPMDGSISLINTVLKPKDEMNPDYYDWLFHTSMFSDEFYKWGHGIVNDLWTTNWTDMKKIAIPIPLINEQVAIADYLNVKCSYIDNIILKTQASIEEYKKLKQSIITQAVTKGVRGKREMKYSGVEWIGNISNDFCLVKLKNVLNKQLQYGANQSGIKYDSSLPRYIRITDITADGKLKDTGALSLSEEDSAGYILENNDILFARSGGTVGKAFIFKSEYGKSAFAGYLIKASLNDQLIPDLMFYYTQSSIYEEWKKQIFIQSTIQNIGADRYREMPIILQSIDEQHEIVEYLEDKCRKIDEMIERKEKLIMDIEAYKRSLIYEYVTGKKEVV